jgi:hypothetical protein
MPKYYWDESWYITGLGITEQQAKELVAWGAKDLGVIPSFLKAIGYE